jgi:uncharacterized phage-associated protein
MASPSPTGIQFAFEPQKAIASIHFLALQNMQDLTKGKIAKLLFLGDKLHLVRYGRTITGDWYAALEHGPIPSRTDNLLDAFEAGQTALPDVEALSSLVELNRGFTYPHIVPKADAAVDPEQFLSRTDVDCLRQVVKHFGDRTFSELRTITHDMPAYQKAWEARTANRGVMAFEDFFEEDEDAIVGIKEEAIENSRIRALLREPAWE